MNLLKKITKIKNKLVALSIIGIIAGSLTININAAQFFSGDNVSVDKVYSNLYIAGDIIKVTEKTEKDLIIAGNTIEVNNDVERNLIVAGNQININSNIGATVRAAGRTVTIKGKVEEDLVLAGQKIVIEDAVIKGDIIVATSDLEIRNSVIQGNALLNTKESKSNWDDQILGEISLNSGKMNRYERKNNDSFNLIGFVYGSVVTLASLIVISIFLNKRNRLIISELKNGKTILKDFLWGLGSIILGFFITILSIIFFNLTIPFVIIIISIGIFSIAFAPIYLANIISTANKNLFYLYILLSLCGLTLLELISESNIEYVSTLVGLILGLFSIAVYGYLLRILIKSIDLLLAKKENNSTEVNSQEI